jgi:hypothetical protein
MIYSDISSSLNPFNLSNVDNKWGTMIYALIVIIINQELYLYMTYSSYIYYNTVI